VEHRPAAVTLTDRRSNSDVPLAKRHDANIQSKARAQHQQVANRHHGVCEF
jgi:hypothetical protein